MHRNAYLFNITDLSRTVVYTFVEVENNKKNVHFDDGKITSQCVYKILHARIAHIWQSI